jgi:hypothetical protein
VFVDDHYDVFACLEGSSFHVSAAERTPEPLRREPLSEARDRDRRHDDRAVRRRRARPRDRLGPRMLDVAGM